MAKRRNYNLRTKASALAVLDRNGGNLHLTSRDVGIPVSTLFRWSRGTEQQEMLPPELDDEAGREVEDKPMDEQLEDLALQMVEMMPEKVQNASLQELARVLPVVLSTLKEVRSRKERRSNAHEKLARLLDHYAAERETTEPVGATHGGRSGGGSV